MNFVERLIRSTLKTYALPFEPAETVQALIGRIDAKADAVFAPGVPAREKLVATKTPCHPCLVLEIGRAPGLDAPYIAAVSDIAALGFDRIEASMCPHHRTRYEQFHAMNRFKENL